MGLLQNCLRSNILGTAEGTAQALLPGCWNSDYQWQKWVNADDRASAVRAGAANPGGQTLPRCWNGPIELGEMSMRTDGAGSLTAALVPSRAMSIDMTGSGDLNATAGLVISMAIAMAGSGSLSASISGYMNMSCDLQGSGDLSADLRGIASMAVDLLGQGDLDATIAAYGNMAIDIVVTGAGLTVANVADAVWGALAADHNDAGTMGAKLNTASSGGVDYGALADAVWQRAIEAGYSAEELMRIISAALAGTSEKAGSTITFKGVDGTTDRIIGSFDAEHNRTGAILDGE